MELTGIVIFVLTYLAVSARRLSWLGFDRPAGALAGAVACVAFGVLRPPEAMAAIDADTLLLLFGVMGMGAFLAVDGSTDRLADAALARVRTPTRLLGAVIWVAGLASALITNDAVCILGAPVLVRLVQRYALPPLPFLIGLATAANAGSVATLVGNPQNMLCATLGGLAFADHLLLMGPVALLGLGIVHLVVWASFRRVLGAAVLLELPTTAHPTSGARAWITPAVILATAVAYTAGAHLAWTAVAGFVLLMLAHRRDTRALWPCIDWSVLLFFAGLFVVVEGFIESGATDALFARFPLSGGRDLPLALADLRLAALFVAGSNLVSNVPFILVVRDQMHTLPDPRMAWELLAMASTFAGNLTLLGSVANVIVAEAARPVGGLGFWEYLRVGFPVAIFTTAVGVAWLALLGAL